MSGVSSFTEVPEIDISGLRSTDPGRRRQVVDRLGAASRDVGFCYLSGTGVAPELFAELLAVTRRFFALPLESKMRYYIGNSTCHRGYVPEGEEVFSGGTADRKEAFDTGLELPADDPDHLAGNPLLGPNQWPELPGFAAAVTAYYTAALDLGRLLLAAFARTLGELPESFQRYVTKPPSQLRLIHYPFDPDARDAQGIGAHTDYECFTLLRPTAPGLEVLNGAGEWIDVPPRPGAFVLNIGDMLETWTNGEFVATTHRVRKVREERYSFPLFFCVDYDTAVAPLPQFVRSDRPARPTVLAGEHLFAQTAQSFGYLKRRIAAGELTLPAGALALSSFGQEARRRVQP
ncbi:MAG TPA: 2-oxoglutarate and iron-dependent oxygenase domain-containing protein [Pseudonocardia sp.]|nr:2-oxoglutarate and iron-dependent oxygenase domain-containing protein [Pseudonocardia sp.]